MKINEKYPADLLISLLLMLIPLSLLHPEYMITGTTATGGDMASQVLGARLFVDEILPSGRLSAWLPEVFGGFPFLSYYFPLPFLAIALLASVLPFPIAFKWGAMLGVILLPGTGYLVGRLLGFKRLPALGGALGVLCFLLHEQHSIWGGNLLSTLAGEFAYSYGTVLAIITMSVWSRGIKTGRLWILGGCLEALVGLCHGYALLVTGFSTLYFLSQPGRLRRNIIYLLKTHLLAFFLLGFWLWPLLELGPYITPNDTPYLLNNWREIFPVTVQPVMILGLAAAILAAAIPPLRRTWSNNQTDHALYFTFSAGTALIGWFSAEFLGLADIRFFPYVWLLGAIAGGWSLGSLFNLLENRTARKLAAAGLLLLTLGFLGEEVRKAPHWTLWNHAGLESKAMWPTLKRLFPAIKGDLNSPRLVFEHDPDNNDIGSTRVLETLPMFTGGRPVMEGLYMESAPLGPVIYQLQSELSTRPSSPLSQYPSGSLDPIRAAIHLRVLNVEDILLRSTRAKRTLARTGLYDKIFESPPFTVYRLKDFTSRYVEPITSAITVSDRREWKDKSFAWFLKLKNHDDPPIAFLTPDQWRKRAGQGWPRPKRGDLANTVSNANIERHRISFTTGAPGLPHLLRFGYNPRWQSVNGETIFLVSPGFMMIVPETNQVELVYGTTPTMRLGRWGTGLALLAVLLGLFSPRHSGDSVEPPAPTPPISGRQWLVRAGGFVLIAAICGLLFSHSPRRTYRMGHEFFRAGSYLEAARAFEQAYRGRHIKAQKEEALFWAARALELAGDDDGAAKHYRQLTEEYHAYWVPESLFRLVTLFKKQGQRKGLEKALNRLTSEFPGNKWTLEAEKIHGR